MGGVRKRETMRVDRNEEEEEGIAQNGELVM